MTDEPDIMLRDFLRSRLTDPNSSRVVGTPYVVDNWPYQTDLVFNNFPRISVINQFDSSSPYGIGSTTTKNTVRLAIDIWVKPDNLVTIGATPYEGFNEVRKITRDITEAIRQYWITDLASTGKVLYGINLNWYNAKRDLDMNLVRRTGDISLVFIRSGVT